MVSGFMTNLSVHSMKPRNMVSWFRGFMVLWFRPPPSLGHQNDYRFHSFMVSLFHSLPSLKMTVGFVVSRFHGFAYSVSWSPK